MDKKQNTEQKLSNEQLSKEFIQWCNDNKKSPKTKEETTQLFHTFMKEKHPKEYEVAMKQQQQNQTQKAAHGMKLQYIKNLKHQCAEDEELYYYKKGGSVGCGCKKKENGGEVVKAGVGVTLAVQAFKGWRKRRAEEAKKKNTWGATSKIVGKDYEKGQKDAGPKSKVQDNAVPNEDIPSHDKKPEEINMHIKAKNDHLKCGGEVVKKFKAKCGSKIKKHQQGGISLPIAQKASERYKGATGKAYGKGNVEIQEIENPNTNAKIKLAIVGNDSTITETPPHSWYITPKNRIASNYSYDGKYLDNDWNVMKRRWKEAKEVMSKVPYYGGPLYGTYRLPE